MAVLRRIKDSLTQAIRKKKKPETVKAVAKKEKKEIPGMQETVIEKTKFSAPPVRLLKQETPQDIPYKYDQDKIVLQVRDPWWIHAYWELKALTLERLRNEFKDNFYQVKRVLRVYDISQIIFTGNNAHRFFDIELNEQANNWYIDTAGPGRSWCVELGLKLADGRFIAIVRSNTVSTPLDRPSWITDEEWMIPDDKFARLYGMGVGFGSSLFSITSPVKKAKEKKF